tara:strand:- start:69 stop:1019 length:951 start_codon:yes stop_codon:yes gene_type:complete
MINTYLLIALIAVVIFLVFYIDKKFKSIGQDDNEIIEQFDAIGELFAGSEKNINDLRDKLSETKSALETTYQNSQKEVTKSLNEFNLIFRSSQERGSLGEYRVEQLLENLGLQENVHWKSQQSYGSARPDYTFYFPDQVYINLDSKFPLEHYKNMVNAEGEFEKESEKKAFEKDVKDRIKEMQKDGYVDVSKGSVDFVLMFVPSQSVLNFIRKEFYTIWEDALKKKVILVGTPELFAMLQMLKTSVHNFTLSTKVDDFKTNFSQFKVEWTKIEALLEKHENQIEAVSKSYQDITTTRNKKLKKSLDLLLPDGDKEK